MDIEVKTDQFRKVVSCASRASSNKAVQPILNNVLLSGEKNFLMVSATDLDLAIECKLPAEISEGGKITLPAKKLDEIVNRIPGENINISIDKNKLAKIFSDKSRFQINGASSDEFPKIITKDGNVTEYKIKQEDLLNAISLTSFSTSRFDTTSILSGANFEIKGKKFEIGATDGSRLARYRGNISDVSKEEKKSVIIPGRSLFELERLISNFKEGNDIVSFYFLPGQIVFQNNDFSLSTRLINGTFPEYDKLIPKDNSKEAVFSRDELLSSLERVAILANERTNVIKMTFKKEKGTVHLDASSPDYGNATDEIGVSYKGDDLEIAFNYKYLAEALRNLNVEKVVLEMNTQLSPIILKIGEQVEYNYTYLVMPVQMR